jgi:hypothetical protein
LGDISFNGNLYQNGTLFQSGSGGGGGLTDLSASSISDLSDVSLNGIQVNQTLKWDGEKLVPTTLATTDTKQGQVLETLAGVCDGRTVVVESGSYTLPNVTTSTTISNTTYDLIPGSSIDYTPPIGSTAIIYEFTFTYGREVTNNTSQWTGFEIKLYLDDIEVTNANTTMFGDNIVRRDSYKWTFKTDGSSNDTANGIVTSWNSSKNIKLKAKARTSCAVHRSEWSITGADNIDEFVIPTVQITAIGESSGQAVTLTNNSVNDLSDISFNSSTTTDGQALVWNATDGVWEAGTVASSGGGLTDLSATSISDLSDVSLNGIQVNQTLKWDGEKLVPTTLATTDTKQGQVLETLAGVCDGRTVVVESGSYTLPNVTTTFEMTDGLSYVDLPNSSFSYKPPTGTSQVIYRFKINITSLDAHGIANFKLYIDNTEVTNFVRSWTGKGPDEDTLILDYTFEIGQANDITNGKFLTWNTTKNIKIKVREYSSSGHEVKFYSRGYWEGSYQYGTDGFVCPSLEIIAIGESSGQAVTLTNNSVNDLSDISFNSSTTTDGQALVWNSTDGVWEAGAVASSGGGVSSGDDISFNNLDISGVLATNKSNNEIKLGAHIIPTTNSTYDLGSAEYKIRHLFLSSNSLWVGDDHKIEISDGKMKFRKLQKDTLPSGLSGIVWCFIGRCGCCIR